MSLHAQIAEAKRQALVGQECVEAELEDEEVYGEGLKEVKVIYLGDVYYYPGSPPRFIEPTNQILFYAIFSTYQNKDYDLSELRSIANKLSKDLPKCMNQHLTEMDKVEYNYKETPTSGSAQLRAYYIGNGPHAKEIADYAWKKFKSCVRSLCKKYGYKVKIYKQEIHYYHKKVSLY